MSCLSVWMDASWHHSQKWIMDVMIILMMEGLNDQSGPFRPPEASCAASAIFPALPFFLLTFRRVILMSLLERYSSLSVMGGRRGVETTSCPSWQRCIKAVMSHPTCQAYRAVRKGGSSLPPFSPSWQPAHSLPCLSSPLTLILCNPEVRPASLHQLELQKIRSTMSKDQIIF